jgi:hypothetical protein
VVELGKSPTLAGETLHSNGGIGAFGMGKLWIQEKRHGLKRKGIAI